MLCAATSAQREIELGADLGEIPEHVAQLALERLAVGVGDLAVAVAKNLLDFARDFARLIGKAERGVDDGVVGGDDVPGLARLALVAIEILGSHEKG